MAVTLAGANAAKANDRVTLICTQDKRVVCDMNGSCKPLNDRVVSRWTFELNLDKHTGAVERCAGDVCDPTAHVFVSSGSSGDIAVWDPAQNDAFAFSVNRMRFTHAAVTAKNKKGHTISEFGTCGKNEARD